MYSQPEDGILLAQHHIEEVSVGNCFLVLYGHLLQHLLGLGVCFGLVHLLQHLLQLHEVCTTPPHTSPPTITELKVFHIPTSAMLLLPDCKKAYELSSTFLPISPELSKSNSTNFSTQSITTHKFYLQHIPNLTDAFYRSIYQTLVILYYFVRFMKLHGNNGLLVSRDLHKIKSISFHFFKA